MSMSPLKTGCCLCKNCKQDSLLISDNPLAADKYTVHCMVHKRRVSKRRYNYCRCKSLIDGARQPKCKEVMPDNIDANYPIDDNTLKFYLSYV